MKHTGRVKGYLSGYVPEIDCIMMNNEFSIVRKHPDMIKYIDSLQRKNAEALSFYPTQVFEREMLKKRLWLGILNGEPCGYLYMGALGNDVKVHQVCIQYDARRMLYGAVLVAAMEDYLKKSHSYSVTLRCGFDLQANIFWETLGYSCIDIVDGGIRRQRKINIWRKQLQPHLFEEKKLMPAEGKTNSSLWRQNKQLGISSAFHRGKQLEQYKKIITNA